jgi:L-lactate dehydrogenase (cytochrome)
MFYDYVESGSWTERTLGCNVDDLQRLKFRQKVAVDFENRSIKSTVLGTDVAMPVALAPTGTTGMIHADGEILAARAAAKFGVPFTLSTMSICSIEDVAEHASCPFWFQLYVMRDRDFMRNLIGRAKRARCPALVVTLDLQIMGQRHKDIKNGLTVPIKPSLANVLNLMSKPHWCLGMSRTSRRAFGNVVGHVKGIDDIASLAAWAAEQFDPTLTWHDLEWIKESWGGKLIVKGIMDADDARRAVECGADAIIVSNHGGRQLDGAPSSIAVLPHIVKAVGADVDVWLDGGMRSGQDVLRALALGAKCTFIGRAFVYGLGAGGQAGVRRALDIIAKELSVTMAFCGRTRMNDVDRSMLINPQIFDELHQVY